MHTPLLIIKTKPTGSTAEQQAKEEEP